MRIAVVLLPDEEDNIGKTSRLEDGEISPYTVSMIVENASFLLEEVMYDRFNEPVRLWRVTRDLLSDKEGTMYGSDASAFYTITNSLCTALCSAFTIKEPQSVGA